MEIKLTKEEVLKAVLVDLFTRTGMRVQVDEARFVFNLDSRGNLTDFRVEIDK
jgi:hypothetical protein